MTTRRTLLAALPGLLAAPAVVQAATDPFSGPVDANAVTKAHVDAQVPMTWDTPIMPTQTGKMGHVFQTRWSGFTGANGTASPSDIAAFYMKNDHRPSLSTFFQMMTGDPVESVHDAEDAFLNAAYVAEETWNQTEWNKAVASNRGKGFWMACVIRRQATLVGQRSRRGHANIALMNPGMIDRIGLGNLVPAEQFERAGEVSGRWTRTAEVPHGITIYCSEHLPMGEAYVLYLGRIPVDAGAILLDHEDGTRSMYMHGAMGRTMTSPSNPMFGVNTYVTRIIFKEADR